MKLVTFNGPTGKQPGLLLDDCILPLPYSSMNELITGGPRALAQIRSLVHSDAHTLPLRRARLRAPLPRPTSLRDFYAFEQHVTTASANRNRPVPEEWYQFPIFYFTNHQAIFGPDEIIPYPSYTQALDYELEIACIIGKPGTNIPAEQAEEYILGFTIMNDWSARDIQRVEMKAGLGPAKGKDFATSLGPWIVTLDELADHAAGRPGVYNLEMSARVNGQERSRSNFSTIYYSFGQILERASADAWLYPGDVIGSGTTGTGCLLELTRAQGPWLQPGDVVELEIEHLGVLRNTIGTPAAPSRLPDPPAA